MHFFAEPRNRDLVERLRAAGLTFTEARRGRADGPLSGKAYVLTGTLPTLTRGAGGRADRGRRRTGRGVGEQEDRRAS